MSAPRFHVARAIAPVRVGETFTLPESVAHHATRVLRLAVGDRLVLFDGNGGEYRARLAYIDKRAAGVQLEHFAPIEREAPVAVTLAQSVLAADAMDVAVRKAVELGVARIVPVLAERSQRVGERERAAKRQQHWQSIAVAACEQCGRNRVPIVDAPVPFDDHVAAAAQSGMVAIAAPGAAESLASLCLRALPRHLIVGPEGGFTDMEVAHAVERGAQPVHLGPRVLRADTATVVGLATIAAVAGDAR